jgi:hypothetical protein
MSLIIDPPDLSVTVADPYRGLLPQPNCDLKKARPRV